MTNPNPDPLLSDIDRAIESIEHIQFTPFFTSHDWRNLYEALTLARERMGKVGTFDNEIVKKAREIIEYDIRAFDRGDIDPKVVERHKLVLLALDSLEREVERLRGVNRKLSEALYGEYDPDYEQEQDPLVYGKD